MTDRCLGALGALSPLTALSPIDGRYASRCDPLRPYLSEYGLVRFRLEVEVQWLVALTGAGLDGLPALSTAARAALGHIVEDFSLDDARRVKSLEAETNHDVKAVEYFLKQRLSMLEPADELGPVLELVHFACTSEDVNNLAYALMIRSARDEVLLPAIDHVAGALRSLAHGLSSQPMLARTHGQPATPTTLGKELANSLHRLLRQRAGVASQPLAGKLNGAVGNYNAHRAAFPSADWPGIAERFVVGLGLEFNPYTTQIEPHDHLAELFDVLARLNTVLIDLCRDLWGYISLGYFRQRTIDSEVGSSTMPHKVNPIDFENAEGNLGLSNALLRHMAETLPVSRWQRDLTDSTVQRNIGVALAHGLQAYESCLKGLQRLEPAPEALDSDLDRAWEVLAEAIQTVMRRHGVEAPYERLKALTRGRAVTRETLQAFVRELPIPESERDRLLEMTPRSYLGFACELARRA